MAAAGKVYPRATFQDFRGSLTPDYQRQFAPRKIVVQFSADLFGTLNAKWEGLEVLSEVATRTDDGVMWKIPHPTITTDDPYYRIWMTLAVASPSATYGQTLRSHADYWEAGVRWGVGPSYGTSVFDYQYRTSPPFRLAWWLVWTDLIDPAQFTGNSGFPYSYMRPATWAEQPEFQPYRTRP